MKKLTLLITLALALVVPRAKAQTIYFITATDSSGCTTSQYFKANISVYWTCTVTGYPNFYFLKPVLAFAGITGACGTSGTLTTGQWGWSSTGRPPFGTGSITAKVTAQTDYGALVTWTTCRIIYGANSMTDPWYNCTGSYPGAFPC